MAEDTMGFRFLDHDEMIFDKDEMAVRDAGMKLMQDVGFDGIGIGEHDAVARAGIGIGEHDAGGRAGIVEIKPMQSPDDHFEMSLMEGADFLF